MVASRSRMPSLVTSPTRAKWPPPTERHSPDSGQSGCASHPTRGATRRGCSQSASSSLQGIGPNPVPGRVLGRGHDHVGGDAVGLALARHRVRQADHAHLRHAVDRAAGTPPNAAPDATLTKRPPPCSAMNFHAGRLTFSTPRSCVSITGSIELVGERRERRHAHLALRCSPRCRPRRTRRAPTARSPRPPSDVANGVGVRDRLAAGGADLVDDVVRGVLRGSLGLTVGVADAHAEVVDHDARAT